MKAGEVAKVERREALRPASLGAHAPQAASPGNRDKAVGVQAARSQGSPKGVSQTPGASRRSIAPGRGEETDEGVPGAFKEYGR